MMPVMNDPSAKSRGWWASLRGRSSISSSHVGTTVAYLTRMPISWFAMTKKARAPGHCPIRTLYACHCKLSTTTATATLQLRKRHCPHTATTVVDDLLTVSHCAAPPARVPAPLSTARSARQFVENSNTSFTRLASLGVSAVIPSVPH
jgi:hypothetical protein